MLRIILLGLTALLLAGCSSTSTQPDDAVVELTPDQLADRVTELYQQIDAAFDESFAAGIDFVIANNYPGAFDPTALQQCALAKQPFLGDNVTGGVPRTDTLELIPNWVGPDTGAADWLLAGKTIAGEVYQFDLEVDLEIIKGQLVVAEGEVFLLYGWCDGQTN